MPAIASSAINYAEYNTSTNEMTLTFSSGGSYTYFNVPKEIYDGLLAASPKGAFYHAYIKDKYGYR